jgi:mannose-6-phosphate isomerase-like protein (cupin superfamily)
MTFTSDVMSDEGLKPSDIGRPGSSFAKPIPTTQLKSCRTILWVAEPAEYHHPGTDAGETFVVVAGRGHIDIEQVGSAELSPGIVVHIPPKTPSSLLVTERLRKLSVLGIAT